MIRDALQGPASPLQWYGHQETTGPPVFNLPEQQAHAGDALTTKDGGLILQKAYQPSLVNVRFGFKPTGPLPSVIMTASFMVSWLSVFTLQQQQEKPRMWLSDSMLCSVPPILPRILSMWLMSVSSLSLMG